MISNRRSRRGWTLLPRRPVVGLIAVGLVLVAGLRSTLAFHDSAADGMLVAAEASLHLLVSEVITGGTSASDEFIEIYNPASDALPLEGLEIVYVTASGGTITRKASWPAGSAPLLAGAHALITNSAGSFGSIGDQTYTGGLAATGGSVAIRIIGATTAIDAAGWGNATSTWLEGTPAVAVAAGHSIERLPGGGAGSGQDTDQNSLDFVDRAAPDPQNTLASSIPVPTPVVTPTPSAPAETASPTPTTSPLPTNSSTATPTPSPSVQSPTPTPTVAATPSPTPAATATPLAPITITEARSQADGSTVTVEGTALTDSAFTDGGGYLADAIAGIAVLVADGSFPRGAALRVTGELDDRFSQRTIRADASGVQTLGSGTDPQAQARTTGTIGEADEGELVEVSGTLTSGPTALTSAVAFDLDDGSGLIRLMVGNASGIDLATWARGSAVHLYGVVGQRDSSGTGTAGYRLQPRDPADVMGVIQPTPSPTPTPSSSAVASPTPSPNPSAISIAAARAQPSNSRVTVRGVVTLPSGLAEEGTAAIQDASGAIVLRLGEEAGTLRMGDLVEVSGTRSTKSGMETLRVVTTPRRLGTQALPDPRQRQTGSLGEADEAVLVTITGTVTTTPRRTSAENVYFDVDDGSGPIRIFASPRADVDTEHVLSGTRVDVIGVLGQETTGKLPDRGYRLWPRRPADLRIIAQPPGVNGGSTVPGTSGTGDGGSGAASGSGAVSPAGGGLQPAKVAQQARPRLHLAAASAVPSTPIAQVQPPGKEVPGGSSPEPLAAGLLLLGGLLLIGSGAATGDPKLPGRLLAWLRDRVRGLSKEDPQDAERYEETTPIGLPRLVPLAVSESGEPASARPARTVHEERGRILPPT